MSRFCLIGCLLVLSASVSPATETASGDWTVVQITDNTTDDVDPKVSGGTVVWRHLVSPGQYEIFMWRDDATTQVTSDDGSFSFIDVGDVISWQKWPAAVQYYDGAIQTVSAYNSVEPVVSGSSIAWTGIASGDEQVFRFDGLENVQLSTGARDKYDIRISGPSTVWWEVNSSIMGEIHLHNGTEDVIVSDGATYDSHPEISDDGDGHINLTYLASAGGYSDLMQYDGTSVTNLTNTPGFSERDHRCCGDRTVWLGLHDNALTVMLHDGTGTIPLSSGPGSVGEAGVSESLVVWRQSGISEVFVYDGSVVTQLTDNYPLVDQHPDVDGGVVVWQGNDGNDNEIYMAYKSPPLDVTPSRGTVLAGVDAYPNPFNPATEIRFETTVATPVRVRIFDLAGSQVTDLGRSLRTPGSHVVPWRGLDARGQAAPAGVYIYAVETPSERRLGKVSLIK